MKLLWDILRLPSSSARPICHSHTMTSTGCEPANIRIAAYRSSPHYTLCHGRRQCHVIFITQHNNLSDRDSWQILHINNKNAQKNIHEMTSAFKCNIHTHLFTNELSNAVCKVQSIIRWQTAKPSIWHFLGEIVIHKMLLWFKFIISSINQAPVLYEPKPPSWLSDTFLVKSSRKYLFCDSRSYLNCSAKSVLAIKCIILSPN